ncbi:MAG TPA: BPSS1780 family membrane protein [Burkholderiales bacterium]|nr:BPSS1780 family membrane protein [Burkholderiales bacterium]
MAAALKIVPATNGLQWLRIGWLLFMRNPLMWILAFSAQWLIVAVLGQIPVIGLVLATLIMPAFSVGFMTMGAAAEGGRPLEPALLFAGFRSTPGPLFALGGAYLIAGALTLLIANFTSDMTVSTTPEGQAVLTGIESMDLLIPGIFFALAHMAFFFAPALTAWHRMTPPKAMFFSFFACLRNWRAFLLYGLALVLMICGGLLLFSLLMALVLGGEAPGNALQNFAFAFILGLMPALLASVYAGYRDIFGGPAAPPG